MKRRFSGGLSLAVLMLALSAVRGWAGDDFQYWSNYEISKSAGPAHEVFYNPEMRFRDDASDFFYHEHRLGLRFKQIKNLGIGLHYLLARTEPAKGPWKTENRGELDLTPKWKWGEWDWSLRGRAELRQIEGSSGDPLEWRFRLKPQVSWKSELFGYSIKPYIADDAYYNAEKDAWNQNRLYLGVYFPLGDRFGASTTLGVHYVFRSDRDSKGDWSSLSAVRTSIALKF